MTEVQPPYALQALSTHTAEGDRMMVSGLLAGARTTGTQMVSRGGVAPMAGGGALVTQTGSPSMAVIVASGVMFVPGSEDANQGCYCCQNDGNVTLAINTAHGSLPRKDAIVARVNDAGYSGATNTWSLATITGTAASSPALPTLPNNNLLLAEVNVAAGASSISNANIVDRRPLLAAAGGIIICNSVTQPNISTVVEGQAIWRVDTGELKFKIGGSYVTRSWPQTQQLTGSHAFSFTGTGATQSVTFSTPFAAAPKVMTNIASGAGVSLGYDSRAFNITTTGFTLFVYGPSATWSAVGCQWAAFT